MAAVAEADLVGLKVWVADDASNKSVVSVAPSATFEELQDAVGLALARIGYIDGLVTSMRWTDDDGDTMELTRDAWPVASSLVVRGALSKVTIEVDIAPDDDGPSQEEPPPPYTVATAPAPATAATDSAAPAAAAATDATDATDSADVAAASAATGGDGDPWPVGSTAVVRFMIHATGADMLSVHKGERITIVSTLESLGWYGAATADGRRGYIPIEYVEIVPE